jgi:uncharacterized protein (DUF1697 family)
MPRAQRYAAFLRGVSPMSLKMADLKSALEAAGFSGVKTLLSSGNAIFTAPLEGEAALARKVEAAVKRHVGTSFFTLVRSLEALSALIEADPYARFRLPAGAKRVVTFLAHPPSPKPKLPLEQDGARILALHGSEAFTAYVPSPKGPVFMTLLQKTFGKDISTRTWDTVKKCVQ